MVTVTKPLPHYCLSSTPKDVALKVEKSFLTLQQNGAFCVNVAAVFLLQRLSLKQKSASTCLHKLDFFPHVRGIRT